MGHDQPGERTTWLGGRWVTASVYDRRGLPPGAAIEGPAIVEQLDTTTFLGLGDRAATLTALEKSFEELNGNTLEYIRTDPFLDPLHGDPRFEALAEKIVPAREFGTKTTSK